MHAVLRSLAVLSAIGLALVAAPALAEPVRPAPPSKPVIIPLEPYLGVLWSFQGEVDGKPRRFLLDTAGGITVISQPFADAIGCKPWGRVTGFRMRGDRVDLPRCDDVGLKAAGLPLTAPTAGVIDFSTLLPKDAPPLDGSVALDAFAGRAVTLDLAGRRLIVETPDSLKARARDGVEVPVRFSRDATGLALTPFVAAPTAKGRDLAGAGLRQHRRPGDRQARRRPAGPGSGGPEGPVRGDDPGRRPEDQRQGPGRGHDPGRQHRRPGPGAMGGDPGPGQRTGVDRAGEINPLPEGEGGARREAVGG